VSGHVLPLAGSDDEWSGGSITPAATCLLAPNPSPWTLDGTNTWVLGERDVVVVDPGPGEPGHLESIRQHLAAHDLRLHGVVLTHGHLDHSEGAREFAESMGVGVRAFDPEHRLGDEGLTDGDVVVLGENELRVVTTPGHSRDSVSLVMTHDGSLITGDTVLGRGTSLVAWPDGTLGDYLTSLQRLRALASEESLVRILPGHGPALADPGAVLDAYLDHRRARLVEVKDVVDSGVSEASEIVAIVYADVPREVWPAAELTVRAQLAYLQIR
jgi:glyoxylase-like metal-dependent hydrolase (beta-lactamase superfamily II)